MLFACLVFVNCYKVELPGALWLAAPIVHAGRNGLEEIEKSEQKRVNRKEERKGFSGSSITLHRVMERKQGITEVTPTKIL